MINKIYTLKTVSQLHCGVGQGMNDIDLPTARNMITGHPLVPGSSLKGVLKDRFMCDKNSNALDIKALFGGDSSNDFASAISIGDANLLALAVRSFFGTFAYLASPYTIKLFKNYLHHQGKKVPHAIPDVGLRDSQGLYKALVCSNSVLKQDNNSCILLEELDLLVHKNTADDWASEIAALFFSDEEGARIFKQRFAIVDDNALNFLCETSLPVDARIAIDAKTGTVKDGALWYEESVPSETLFIGNLSVDSSKDRDHSRTAEELFQSIQSNAAILCQVGGKSTTGKGLVEINFSGEEI